MPDCHIKGIARLSVALVAVLGSITAVAEDIDIYKSRVCSVESDSIYRFIFVVDNSGSMSSAEFAESKATIDASIAHVLDSLDDVQVAVVQYGTYPESGYATAPVPADVVHHDYDVTVPFTADRTIATDWSRVFGPGTAKAAHIQDHTPASLASMRMDDVYAPGGALDITDGDNVQFVFFTDAARDNSSSSSCCSSIVAGASPYVGDDVLPGFGEYDALKRGAVLPGGIEAQFTVLNNSALSASMAASAAIASVGGSYTGAVEANAEDPDGSGIHPRRFVSGTLSASEDVSGILALLDEVIGEISLPPVSASDSFMAASIDMDRAVFASDERAYFSLFAPSDARAWRGNVKGYYIDGDGLIDVHGAPATARAADGSVGFADSAQSFWSSAADGPDVLAGGASEGIVAAPVRNLYTYLGDGSAPAPLQQRVESGNPAITAAMLGVGTEAQRTSTLDWLQSAPMGDSLHTQPVLVRYAGRSVLYAVTNQGILHAIDATRPSATGDTDGGEELWGFIPKELLANLPLLGGATTAGSHVYGLDGAITRWHDDENRDGVVNGDDRMLLVFGQRRGGRSYFALDVTDPQAPAWQWQITGGVTAGFGDLMQTWSRPALIRVASSGSPATAHTEKDTQRVLVFAGGYDAEVLDDTTAATAAGGGAIYIVDRDGELLWKTENRLHYSMPADLAVIDSDDDALADRIYAADLGGQVWRLDITDITDINLKMFASVERDGHQPFFYPPSVSHARLGGQEFLAVIIGSGNRTRPLDAEVQNHLYMLKDKDIEPGPPPGSSNTLLVSTLHDATAFELGSSDESTRQRARESLMSGDGWKIALAPGEMVLASAQVVENVLYATTFQPVYDGDPSVCETAASATTRLYSLRPETGAPVTSATNGIWDMQGLDATQRSVELPGDGIAGPPVSVFPRTGDSVKVLVGKDVVSEVEQRLVRVFWRAN